MSSVRFVLRRLAAVTLALQVALPTTAALVICLSASVAQAEAECTCDHNGVMCPMHQANRGSKDCAFRSGPDHDAMVPLTALFGASGTLTANTHAPRIASTLVRLPVLTSSAFDSHRVPPSPPPRA